MNENGYFDPALANVFGFNGEGPVFNPVFNKWREHLEYRLMDRDSAQEDLHYLQPEDEQLFEECKEHAKKYERKIERNNVILLVHPLYLGLSHFKYLTKRTLSDFRRYIGKLSFLVNKTEDERNADIVLLETAHHYAAATSLLAERGLASKVIFTLSDEGRPKETKELKKLKKKRILLGGGYNGDCLKDLITELKECMRMNSIYVVKDLALDSPQDRKDSLTPNRIIGLEGEERQFIDWYDMFDLLESDN